MRWLVVLVVAHSWYPQWCCGGADCHPVPCAGIVIGDAAVLPSPDGQCHACDHLGTKGYQHRYCVFVPQAIS